MPGAVERRTGAEKLLAGEAMPPASRRPSRPSAPPSEEMPATASVADGKPTRTTAAEDRSSYSDGSPTKRPRALAARQDGSKPAVPTEPAVHASAGVTVPPDSSDADAPPRVDDVSAASQLAVQATATPTGDRRAGDDAPGMVQSPPRHVDDDDGAVQAGPATHPAPHAAGARTGAKGPRLLPAASAEPSPLASPSPAAAAASGPEDASSTVDPIRTVGKEGLAVLECQPIDSMTFEAPGPQPYFNWRVQQVHGELKHEMRPYLTYERTSVHPSITYRLFPNYLIEAPRRYIGAPATVKPGRASAGTSQWEPLEYRRESDAAWAMEALQLGRGRSVNETLNPPNADGTVTNWVCPPPTRNTPAVKRPRFTSASQQVRPPSLPVTSIKSGTVVTMAAADSEPAVTVAMLATASAPAMPTNTRRSVGRPRKVANAPPISRESSAAAGGSLPSAGPVRETITPDKPVRSRWSPYKLAPAPPTLGPERPGSPHGPGEGPNTDSTGVKRWLNKSSAKLLPANSRSPALTQLPATPRTPQTASVVGGGASLPPAPAAEAASTDAPTESRATSDGQDNAPAPAPAVHPGRLDDYPAPTSQPVVGAAVPTAGTASATSSNATSAPERTQEQVPAQQAALSTTAPMPLSSSHDELEREFREVLQHLQRQHKHVDLPPLLLQRLQQKGLLAANSSSVLEGPVEGDALHLPVQSPSSAETPSSLSPQGSSERSGQRVAPLQARRGVSLVLPLELSAAVDIDDADGIQVAAAEDLATMAAGSHQPMLVLPHALRPVPAEHPFRMQLAAWVRNG